MSEWKAKRFWKQADCVACDGGWQVQLDGRPVKTPAKAPLVLPSESLARAIAAEWDAQDENILPLTMPFTRSANAAIDRVVPQKAEVTEMLAAYGETDLLCYRAEQPVELIQRQAAAWDPLLDWAHECFGARLNVHNGVIFGAQPEDAVALLGAELSKLDAFELTAIHDLIAMSGSLVLGLAIIHGRIDSSEAWELSRLDEEWQIEQWGRDEEAAELAAKKREEFLQAERLFQLLRAS